MTIRCIFFVNRFVLENILFLKTQVSNRHFQFHSCLFLNNIIYFFEGHPDLK
jgi:hypothetical protein